MDKAGFYPAQLQIADHHRDFLDVRLGLGPKMLMYNSYFDAALILSGLRSLAFMYENMSSIGARLY